MYSVHAPAISGVNFGKLSHPLAAGIRWMYIVPPWHTNSNKLHSDDTGLSVTYATTIYATSRLGVTPWGFLCAQMVGTETVPLYRVNRITSDSDTPFTTIAFVTFEGATNTNRDAVNKGDISTTNGTWTLGIGSVARRFRAAVRLGGTLYSAQMTTDAEVGRWYCIAMTYDDNTLRLYVDGIEQASSTIGVSYTDNNNYYYVGIRSTVASSTNWNGWIGSVLHYKRALSSYEISAIASDPRFTWWFGETINYRALDFVEASSTSPGILSGGTMLSNSLSYPAEMYGSALVSAALSGANSLQYPSEMYGSALISAALSSANSLQHPSEMMGSAVMNALTALSSALSHVSYLSGGAQGVLLSELITAYTQSIDGSFLGGALWAAEQMHANGISIDGIISGTAGDAILFAQRASSVARMISGDIVTAFWVSVSAKWIDDTIARWIDDTIARRHIKDTVNRTGGRG